MADVQISKKSIYISIILILCIGCFFSGRFSTSRKSKELENRIAVIQSKLDDSISIVESLKTENGKITESNRQLDDQNERFRNIIAGIRADNERLESLISGIADANSDIGQRIENAQAGVGNVDKGISAYIKKAESPE